MCLLKMSRTDKNKISVPNLPVLIVDLKHCKSTTRYYLCSKDGYLAKTYGREQLLPQPQLTAQGMGIDLATLDKNKLLSMTRAGETYIKSPGRLSKFGCKSDCKTNGRCKCYQMKKHCTKYCHGKNGHHNCTNC